MQFRDKPKIMVFFAREINFLFSKLSNTSKIKIRTVL